MVYFLETENGSLLFDSSCKRALFTCLVSLSGHHQKRCRSYGIVLLSQFHRRRRPRREKWVFVSFDTQYVPARPYLRLVRRRNAATLLGIMQRQVQPGSILHTDQWAAYRQIQRQLGLNHRTVNHSLHFVDPVTGVHTQHAESNWSTAKEKLKKLREIQTLTF